MLKEDLLVVVEALVLKGWMLVARLSPLKPLLRLAIWMLLEGGMFGPLLAKLALGTLELK